MASRSTRDARRRALGRNFLIDDRAIAAVIGTLHPPPGATVVDLGAGAGALTSRLAAADARVIAVERDRDWARRLRAHATRWGEVEVVQGDALAIAFPSPPFFVVSNAPFNPRHTRPSSTRFPHQRPPLA